ARRRPVPAKTQPVRRPRQGVAAGKATDVGERGRLEGPVPLEQQEVGDNDFVQLVGDEGMLPEAPERIAHDERVAALRVEERLDPERIASTEQPPLAAVPDRKREIAE